MAATLKSAIKRMLPPSIRGWVMRALGRDKGHWCRVVMNAAMERFIRNLPCANLDVLEISGTKWADPSYGFRSYRAVQYPGYDVCEGPPEGQYDLVIAEQVFEHIEHPDRAARNVLATLKPGGIFAINTPFLVRYHECPFDFYRWSESGIRALLERAGFSRVETGSWGNRACVIRDMTPDDGWAMYNRFLHSLENDPRFPVVVWAFAWKR